MDLSLTPEQEAFGATVRAWLKTKHPPRVEVHRKLRAPRAPNQ